MLVKFKTHDSYLCFDCVDVTCILFYFFVLNVLIFFDCSNMLSLK